ncbi:MAG: SDR family NAD(P)-dependent oxidoreductase [Flavobacteriales bacterium]|nr:SDR family NAD(P)-dependent oxidoreductase [Flavobacteriales bacterium]
MTKTAFITGSGKGIGKAIAELLLLKGYQVFGYSRSNSINHTHFSFTKIDLTDLEKMQKLSFPKVKGEVLLINNAGTIGEIKPLNLKSEKAIINEYNLNIIAPTLLCKKFLESFPTQEKLILNISSGAANKSIPSWSTYCATKAALDMLTGVIAEENHKNLTVFSVHPGVVDTNMQSEIRNSDPKNFPLLSKFIDYYIQNELESTKIVAQKLFYIIKNNTQFTENVLSIRDVNIN